VLAQRKKMEYAFESPRQVSTYGKKPLCIGKIRSILWFLWKDGQSLRVLFIIAQLPNKETKNAPQFSKCHSSFPDAMTRVISLKEVTLFLFDVSETTTSNFEKFQCIHFLVFI